MGLTGLLSATVEDDGVTFTFAVRNEETNPVDATFSDAQRVECVVTRDDETVWRYSDGRMFAMAVGTETYEPGSTETYELRWEEPPSGTYEARAELVANDASCEGTATFTV